MLEIFSGLMTIDKNLQVVPDLADGPPTISDDGKVFIWDAETYQQLAVYSGYESMFENN